MTFLSTGKMEARHASVLALLNAGHYSTTISRQLGVYRRTLYDIKHKWKERGAIKFKFGSGRLRSARTSDLKRKLKLKIKRNPTGSIMKLAKEHKVSRGTISNALNDMGMSSKAKASRYLINGCAKEKRLQRCRSLLHKIKPEQQPIFLFTDEKLFTVDSTHNRRNDRFISIGTFSEAPAATKFHFKTKHPASVMVFGLVSSDGKKMPLVFVDQGVKITADVYIDILQKHVKPWIDKNYSQEDNVIFQQNRAPAHTAKKTQDWLEANLKNFLSKIDCPPSSPDLYPLDYSMWATLEAEACKTPKSPVAQLKAFIKSAWRKMTPKYIMDTSAFFRPRLEQVIKVKGAHIE